MSAKTDRLELEQLVRVVRENGYTVRKDMRLHYLHLVEELVQRLGCI